MEQYSIFWRQVSFFLIPHFIEEFSRKSRLFFSPRSFSHLIVTFWENIYNFPSTTTQPVRTWRPGVVSSRVPSPSSLSPRFKSKTFTTTSEALSSKSTKTCGGKSDTRSSSCGITCAETKSTSSLHLCKSFWKCPSYRKRN